MQPSDVIRKILSVLPIEKYGHIVMVLHQGDLSTATTTQILGKINTHEMYMHITPKMALLPPRRKIWHSRLVKRRRAKQELIMIAQVMMKLMMQVFSYGEKKHQDAQEAQQEWCQV